MPSETMMDSTDQHLLKEFADGHVEIALQTTLQRYGSLVKGVCARVLGNPHDADDALQAVFLIFVRKAASLSPSSNLTAWFSTVSFRCAVQLRKLRAERQKREVLMEEDAMNAIAEPIPEAAWETIRPILDEELDKLSEKYRLPLAHCYLEGLSYEDAAQKMGVGHKTLKIRLERARDLLRKRLVRRGVTVSSAALGTVILQNASSSAYAMSDAAIQSTVQSVMASTPFGVVNLVSSGVPLVTPNGVAIEVMKGVMQAMLYKKIFIAAMAVAAVSLAIWGSVAITSSRFASLFPQRSETSTRSSSTPVKPWERKTPSAQSQKTVIDWEERLRLALAIVDEEKRHTALYDLTWEVVTADTSIALRLIEKIPLEADRNHFFNSVFYHWGYLDPKAATQRALAYSKPEELNPAVSATAEGWAAKDPAAAATWALQLKENVSQLLALASVAGAWAAQDPMAAAQWAKQLPDDLGENGMGIFNVISGITGAWFEKDPSAARQWVLQLPEGRRRNAGVECYAQFWARKDPSAAAAWIQQLPKNGISQSAFWWVAREWAGKDPTTASQWAQGLPNGENRNAALAGVAGQWVEQDPSVALEWAQGLPNGENRNAALAAVGRQWAARDPSAAIQMALQMTDFNSRNEILTEAARQWAQKDLAAAAQWALNLPQGDERDKAERHNVLCNGVARAWAEKDPKAAAQWVLQLPEEDQTVGYVVGRVWAETDPIAAVQWALQLKPPKDKDDRSALEGVLEIWIVRDQRGALAWADNAPAAIHETVDTAIVKGQVMPLAMRSAAVPEVIASVGELPAHLRQTALKKVIGSSWPDDRQFKKELAGWLQKQPPGPSKDDLIEAWISDSYPELNMDLIVQMSDEDRRNDRTVNYFSHWVATSPEAARQWLDQARLPEEAKAKLNKLLPAPSQLKP